MPLPGREDLRDPGLIIWVMLERDGRRGMAPLVPLFTNQPTTSTSTPTTRSISIANRRRSWRSARLATNSKFLLELGESRLLRPSLKPVDLTINLADPASVFIYRGETREVAEAMGIDCSKFQGPIIPVIYNINFRNPGSQFLATTFEMRNKDVIYVANSVSVEATKFLTYIRTVNSTLNDPINSAINAYTLKNMIQGTGNVSTAVFTGSTPIVAAPVSP